jgi:hypothetical protein
MVLLSCRTITTAGPCGRPHAIICARIKEKGASVGAFQPVTRTARAVDYILVISTGGKDEK